MSKWSPVTYTEVCGFSCGFLPGKGDKYDNDSRDDDDKTRLHIGNCLPALERTAQSKENIEERL